MKRSTIPMSLFRALALVLLTALLLGMLSSALAGDVPRALDGIVLSNFRILNSDGTGPPPPTLHLGNRVQLHLDWSATPMYDYQLHEGDYFEFQLPKLMWATEFAGNINFKLMDETGRVPVANGRITRRLAGGGTVRITFTDFVEGKADVKGNLYILAEFVNRAENIGPAQTYEITYGSTYGSTVLVNDPPIAVGARPVQVVTEEAFRKWSFVSRRDSVVIENEAGWNIRINAHKKLMRAVTITDKLVQRPDYEVPLALDANSFTLQRVLLLHAADGSIERTLHLENPVSIDPADPRLTINDTGDGFTFTLGDTQTAGEAFPGKYPEYADHYMTYLLRYKSSYEPGKPAANYAKGSYNGLPEEIFRTSYVAQEAGGGGTGDFAGLTVQKRWVGGEAADYAKVAFRLLQDDKPFTPPEGSLSVTQLSERIFNYRWSKLPVTNPGTGEKYRYAAAEAGAEDGFVEISGRLYAVTQEGNVITNAFVEPAQLSIQLSKELTGAALTAGAFRFQLFGDDLSTPLDTQTNALDGSVRFDVQFDKAGDYTLHVKEVDAGAEGMAYDDSLYKLRYRVAMGEGNRLAAELLALEKDGKAIDKAFPLAFVNSFATPTPVPRPTPASTPTPRPTVAPPPDPGYAAIRVPLTARKVLRNGSLQAGSYAFQLLDGAGKVLATVSNHADGLIVFPDRSFSRVVSNYRYTIREVPGSDDRITYDDTVYTVKVSTRAVAGRLEATVEIEKDGTPYAGEMTFVNQRKAPPTGDHQFRSMMLLLGASLALLGSAVMLRVRRQRSQ